MSNEDLSRELELLKKENESLADQVEKLKYRDYLLKMILTNIPQCIYFKDPDGKYTGSSNSTFKKFGLSDEKDIIGQSDEAFYTEYHHKVIKEKENRVLDSGKPIIDEEVEESWSDGTKTYSINSILPLKDKSGENLGIFGISTDITKQKEADFALQNNLNFLEVLINTLPTPIFYKDNSGKFQGCNDAFTSFIGKSRNDLIGKTVFDIFPGNAASSLHQKDRQLLKTKGVQNFEVHFESADGPALNVMIHQASFINYDDQIIGLVGGIINITDQKVNEKKLTEYTEELRTTNSNKDRFFSIIAHDLKNPFITLLGYTEALIEDYYSMKPEEHLDYLSQIQATSKTSYQLLENLLQWSRSQSGKLKIERLNFNIFEVIEEVTSLKNSQFKSKSLTCINNVDKDLNIYADKDMIKTVLRNLITNAIKFTHDGGSVTLSSKVENDSAIVTVKDTGIGISENEIKHIFDIDKFQSTAGTRNETGTGLGLVLCQEFITKNSGKIWVESEVDKGSSFSFELPLGAKKQTIN